MAPEQYAELIHFLWQKAARDGLNGLKIETIIYEMPAFNPDAIRRLIPTSGHAILLLFDAVRAQAQVQIDEIFPETDERPADASPHDYLFDVIMAHFDAARPYQAAIARLWGDLFLNPMEVWTIAPYFMRVGDAWLLASGGQRKDFWVHAQKAAFQILLLATFKTWVGDETPDQSKTMMALDKNLKDFLAYSSFH